MIIYTTSKFKKSYQHLPTSIKEKAVRKEGIFRENPFHPSLDTHSLQGIYKGYWAFWVDDSYRIMFQFLDTARTKIVFINIGTHEIYR